MRQVLSEFFADESLEEGCNCPHCGGNRRALVRKRLATLPQILVVQLRKGTRDEQGASGRRLPRYKKKAKP